MQKPLNWFEIPVSDLGRACSFYEKMLRIQFRTETMGPMAMAVFPYDPAVSNGGCLMSGPGYEPALGGPILYLNAGNTLDATIDRTVANGGSVLLPRTALPPGMGFFAHVMDSEGNRIGLHGQS